MKSKERKIYCLTILSSLIFDIIGIVMIKNNMGRLSITGFLGYCIFFSSLTAAAVILTMIISQILETKVKTTEVKNER